MTSEPAYRIGEWSVEPSLNEIERAGETVRLEPKTMEVLVFLADRAGRVVTRDELLSAVWPGVVVGDAALTQAVIKLRKALRDPARSPLYIETISKRGYRLVARVERGEAGSAAPPMTEHAGEDKVSIVADRRRRWVRRAVGTGAVFALLVVAATAYRAMQSEQDWSALAGFAFEETGADRSPALPTITVMPFETLAEDTEQAYLARGFTSDLTTDLYRLSGLRVVSVAEFSRPVADVSGSRAPAARYIVSGSLQRTAEQLRINVRLIDTESRQQLWAQRYERPFAHPFAMNEEIIGQLLAALPIQVSGAERRRLAKRYTRNLEAYDNFLRGQAALLSRQRLENSAAREMYRKAIDLDPAFGRAYAGLALTHAADYRNQWTAEGPRALARAIELAETARRIDPELAEVYGVLGYVHTLQRQHERAAAHLKRAVALDRSYADAYAYMGALYTHVGQPAKAVPLLRTAMRLNPDAGFIYFLVLGRAYLFQGDTEQALINLREAVNRNAADLESRVFMAATFAAAGDMEAAAWEAEEIRALQPDFSTGKWLETYPMTDANQRQRLVRLLAQLGL